MTNTWNVDLVERTHGRTCWAACVAMLVNHRDGTSLTDGDIASLTGVESHSGAVAGDSDYPSILEHYMFYAVNRYTPNPREWDELLRPGPVIAAFQDRVVVVGGVGDEHDPQTCELYILDPAYGAANWVPYAEIDDRFGFYDNTELLIVQP